MKSRKIDLTEVKAEKMVLAAAAAIICLVPSQFLENFASLLFTLYSQDVHTRPGVWVRLVFCIFGGSSGSSLCAAVSRKNSCTWLSSIEIYSG